MTRFRSQLKIKYIALAAILLAGAVFFLIDNNALTFYGLTGPESAAAPAIDVVEYPPTAPTVSFGSTVVLAELATTTADIRKGLSGRPLLDPNSGMLFVFSKPYVYRFWMSDMMFPLDMIWIRGGVVVDISANATTTFNPSAPNFYFPDEPAQYVLEVNAGFAAAHGIVPGDVVIFKNIPTLP